MVRLYDRLTPDFVVERGRDWVSYRGPRTVYLRNGSGPPRGIYLRGACDAPAMFTLAPLVIDELRGSLCVHMGGTGVSDARSDLLLQTFTGVSPEFVEDVRSSFRLPGAYFEPTLFEPEFSVRGLPESERFPKTVVVLSVLPDLTRTMYRHRATGYLVDPGAGWLNDLAGALEDLSFVDWFRRNFESIGLMSADDFGESYRRLVPAIREATGAHVLVFNALEVEPSDATHDYSVRDFESATRRRRFNVALAELAEELGFRVIDVDRVLKEQGIERQVDFSHFPVERMRAVAVEARRILRDLGVL
ncbi:MAG TPA: SGNH/GDSL hydrolase family protein [Actinomycetota bacterium]|nr:SGNH/GDSL hydrolase family protein [Actinomycetota bacterium]